MVPSLLLIFFIFISSKINAFEPSCSTCNHYIENKIRPELGCCKMFKNFIYNDKGKEKKNLYEYSMHCRNNENLCGKSGFLYEEKINIENLIKNSDYIDYNEIEITDSFNELNNRCCGEVNEDYEIEQLERDFFDLFQKIKRFNTKKIYKTTKDLYNLFKRK